MLRLQSTFSSWREYLSPVSHVSTFKQTGEITPEEFVLAGDYLAYKFPTWSWSPAPPSKRRDFLPADKQFLVTKHVASHVRAQAKAGDYEPLGTGNDETVDEDGWTISHLSKELKLSRGVVPSGSILSQPQDDIRLHAQAANNDEDADSILDIDDLEEHELDDSGYLQDPAADEGNNSTRLPDRSYNLYITYSTSYRVPKMYLSGFNAAGGPLTPDEMFEDIVSEYKDKTVTIEAAPFMEHTTMVSIHPCRHASVMKMLLIRAEARQRRLRAAAAAAANVTNARKNSSTVAQLEQDDLLSGLDGLGLDSEGWEDVSSAVTNGTAGDEESEEAIRVDQYLVIFLKFISSVTPGIEHDNTMTAL
ncbi:autophagocytosis associated protein [Lipomyces japonicus]|uniref:autophagocytosis associated protein n=1 Tax=Lipomyces japonicus TaxID=56871 RepID=UPI0034CFB31F